AVAFWIAHSLPFDHAEYGMRQIFDMRTAAVSLINAFFPFFNITAHSIALTMLAAAIAYLILGLVFVSFLGRPLCFLILAISLTSLFGAFLFVQAGDYRHHGFILISIVFVLWIAQDYPQELGPFLKKKKEALIFWAQRARSGALILMAICFLLGLRNVYFVYELEYHLDFSGAKRMALAIEQLDEKKHIFS
ncbi:MAG: hypothetical protein PHU49_16750, partial [Syntrophorhabdaceae bacterium]|nr:hypothetical protein [Syntrophorhabdaceae bacterium]